MRKSMIMAVALAFATVACNQPETASAPAETNAAPSASGGISIAYVNMDTLQVKYGHYKTLADQLKKEIEVADQNIRKKQKALQESYALFEQKAPTMTQEELQYYSQDIQRTEQNVMMEQQRMESELMQKQQVIFEELQVELDSVLSIIKADQNLDFVFTYPIGSGLLAVNEKFDITVAVTEKLNAIHETIEE